MSRHRIQQRMLLGIFILIIGVLSLLDNLRIFDARSVLHFWPMVFMAFGALKLYQSRSLSGYVIGGGLVLAGVLMTLQRMELINLHWRDWWPLVLIAVGVLVIFKDKLGGKPKDGTDGVADPLSKVDVVAVMSGNNLKIDSQDFRGGEITAFMGGVDLDLRRAAITGNDVTVNLFVMWGGVTLKIPNDWTVVLNGMPIMGGIDDKTVPPMERSVKRLIIEGHVLMGGVEILN